MGGFEEEIRRLHGKRWVASGSTLLRTNVGGMGGAGGSGANSGTSTPYAGRSGLGSTVFVEEEEDEMEEMERTGGGGAMGSGTGLGIGGGAGNTVGGLLMAPASVFAGGFADRDLGRMRTLTGVSSDASTLGPSLSTYKVGDVAAAAGGSSPSGGVNAGAGASGSGTGGASTSTATLTPVTALPTSDSEAQIGLAKIAEADVDAFMTYAAIVPEYCRLEGMLCKSLV